MELGEVLRDRRKAAGRTIASVAADAGLSVPYVANLENGRGNPTTTALSQLATALGTDLRISFSAAAVAEVPVPPSLVRLSRTHRFQRDVRVLAEKVGDQDVTARVVTAMAHFAHAVGRDLTEADWWRLLDALLLVGVHPA